MVQTFFSGIFDLSFLPAKNSFRLFTNTSQAYSWKSKGFSSENYKWL